MEDICRLCCSTNFVNNDIFDEENALYVKMSLYLPIKVFKNDRLPQKVCDKCSCKVNDFYQFCNETIEVQNRLRALFLSSDNTEDASVDLTLIKDNASPLPSAPPCEQSTQTDTDKVLAKTDIKQEPVPSPTLVKQEENTYESDHSLGNCSDNSEDMSLITLKKRKNTKKEINGIDKKTKKKKPKLKDWEMLMKALPEGTAISLVDKTNVPDVKEECKEEDAGDFVMPIDMKKVKSEVNQGDTFHCCVCLAQCYSRTEMRQHYRMHKEPLTPGSEPAPPPPPPGDLPLRCTRCRKEVTREGWAQHWQRHWQRDRRPYRCALCEKSFRDHHQILKHGLTHSAAAAVRVRLLPGAVRVHALPAGAPHARAPRGGVAAAGAALRHVRALVRAPELAAAAPALALGRAQLPVQRVRQGAVVARAPQVPHPHPHGLQAQRVRHVRQGLREEVQPHAARARALGREAARVLALRQGLQPALHARHPRAVPQRRAALLLRAVRPRLRRQGAALHAPQDHLHIAALQVVAGGGRAGDVAELYRPCDIVLLHCLLTRVDRANYL